MLNNIKLAIVGSRGIHDYKLLEELINLFPYDISLIISGGAEGVDRSARVYSVRNAIALVEYLPDWNKYGKAAGCIRNKDIIKNADYVLIIWDGLSKGTQNDIELCKKYNKPYYLHNLLSPYRIYSLGIPDMLNAKKEPGWRTWVGMLKRVTLNKLYTGVKIDPSWLMFSQFQKWYLHLTKLPGWHMDKDLLSEGTHSHYGPDVCVYLPADINEQLLRKRGYEIVNGEYIPIITKYGKIVKGLNCLCEEDARELYIKMKLEYMKELVDNYSLFLPLDILEKLLNYNYE